MAAGESIIISLLNCQKQLLHYINKLLIITFLLKTYVTLCIVINKQVLVCALNN